jgi:hypothetical protein
VRWIEVLSQKKQQLGIQINLSHDQNLFRKFPSTRQELAYMEQEWLQLAELVKAISLK